MRFKGLDFSAKGIHFVGNVVDNKGKGQVMLWDIRNFNNPESSKNAKKIEFDGKK